jgi:DNA-binding response OmpR family regulator
MNKTVFLLEDDLGIARAIIEGLDRRGISVIHARSLAEADESLAGVKPSLCLLDVMLPDGSGLELLHKLRRQLPKVPICMLTARDAVEDKVEAFAAGADDYLSKPFDIRELSARVEALIRRIPQTEEGEEDLLVIGNLVVNRDARLVKVEGAALDMTRREFDLLHEMAAKPGVVFSREQLLNRVWPQTGDVNLNTVDVYISYVRKKLHSARADVLLTTVRGVGFRLDREPSQ